MNIEKTLNRYKEENSGFDKLGYFPNKIKDAGKGAGEYEPRISNFIKYMEKHPTWKYGGHLKRLYRVMNNVPNDWETHIHIDHYDLFYDAAINEYAVVTQPYTTDIKEIELSITNTLERYRDFNVRIEYTLDSWYNLCDGSPKTCAITLIMDNNAVNGITKLNRR